MNHTLLRRLLPFAIAAVLLGAACSGGDDDTAQLDRASSDEPTDSTAPPDDDAQDTSESTEAATDTSGGSLGSSTGQHPAGAGADTEALVPLRIDVTSLERNGELVELTMTLTNEHEDEDVVFKIADRLHDPTIGVLAGEVGDISGVRLIDQGERRAYLPVLDSEGVCLCSNEVYNVQVAAGASLDLHASFGGVPDTVTTFDVEVPGFSPIAGLEVQG